MAEENPYNLSLELEKAEILNEEAQSLVKRLTQTFNFSEKKEVLDKLYEIQFKNYLTHVGIKNEMQKSLKDMPEDFYQDVKAGVDAEERAYMHLQESLEKIREHSDSLSTKS